MGNTEKTHEKSNRLRELIEEIAIRSLMNFIGDCMETAKKNWSESQVEMLKTLFDAVAQGAEYKCVKCEYFGRVADAPETVKKDCMWHWLKDEDEGDTPPCEEE